MGLSGQAAVVWIFCVITHTLSQPLIIQSRLAEEERQPTHVITGDRQADRQINRDISNTLATG